MSYQPTRRRKRQMKRFKSAQQAQRFPFTHAQVRNLFHLRRDHLPAVQYRAARNQAFQTWAEITGMAAQALLSPTLGSPYFFGRLRPDKLTVPFDGAEIRPCIIELPMRSLYGEHDYFARQRTAWCCHASPPTALMLRYRAFDPSR